MVTAALSCGASGCFFVVAAWLDRPNRFHLRGDFGLFTNFFGAGCALSVFVAICLGSESSDTSVVSWLLIDGVVNPERSTAMGFGTFVVALSDVLSRWIDRRAAKVGFIAGPSESLLSDGRRNPRAGVCVAPRGSAEGHKELPASWDDKDTSELFFDPRLGREEA